MKGFNPTNETSTIVEHPIPDLNNNLIPEELHTNITSDFVRLDIGTESTIVDDVNKSYNLNTKNESSNLRNVSTSSDQSSSEVSFISTSQMVPKERHTNITSYFGRLAIETGTYETSGPDRDNRDPFRLSRILGNSVGHVNINSDQRNIEDLVTPMIPRELHANITLDFGRLQLGNSSAINEYSTPDRDNAATGTGSSSSDQGSIEDFSMPMVPEELDLNANITSTSYFGGIKIENSSVISESSTPETDTAATGTSSESSVEDFIMPSPRKGTERYNLRPKRFVEVNRDGIVRKIEVIDKDGKRLVDEHGKPLKDENGQPVINEYGRCVKYPTGNFVIDRNGNRLL